LNLTRTGGAKGDKPKEVIPDGDWVKPRRKGQKVEPKELRELCELIRKRYSLDLDICSLQQTNIINRPVALDRAKKAEATLTKINRILDSWDTADAFAKEEDRAKFQEIRTRIKMNGKRDWTKHPPF